MYRIADDVIRARAIHPAIGPREVSCIAAQVLFFLSLVGTAAAHELPADVLQRFVAVLRDAGCSMSITDLDRGPVSALFSPDEVWHAVSQLLNEGRARIEGGLTFTLTKEECA